MPEGEIGERVILSDDPVPVEIGIVKTIGTRKVGFDVDPEQLHEWNSSDEDDARIDEFLENQMRGPPQKRVCMFY